MTSANGFVVGCLAVASLVGVRAASDAVAATGVVLPPVVATVQMPPAADERGGAQKVAVGVEVQGFVSGTGWGGSAGAPIATDSDGTERVVPAALWSAIVEHFPHHEHAKALSVAHCESRYKADAVSAEGARGIWQVMPLHGEVPDDYAGQALQASELHARYGWGIWLCQ